MSSPGTEVAAVRRCERINGADLHYWIYGPDHKGPDQVADVVVMVHGLRGTHHGLEAIVAQLPDRCVVVPDLPGFGDSTPMTRRHDVAGYASAILELIERVVGRTRPTEDSTGDNRFSVHAARSCSGVPQNIVLLGHSFGSVIAARVASRAPELVRRLILVNPIATPPLRGPRTVLSWLTSAYYWLGKALPARWGNALLSNKWIVLAASRAMVRTKDKRLQQFIHDSHLRYFSRFHSPAVLCESYESSICHTVAEDAPSLTMPTLLIAGETDDIAPLAGQHALAGRMAGAELVVLPDVGHLVHYETPVAAGHAIQRFLETPRVEAP